MKIKFINTLNGHYEIKKRLYKVYATYNYLGEIFYCVKTKKWNYDRFREKKPKYTYLEKKTGARIIISFAKDKILTRKEFVRAVRKKVKKARQYKHGNNIREFLENRVKEINEFREEFTK